MLLAVLSPEMPGLVNGAVHRLHQASEGELLAALALLVASGLCLALVRGWILTGLAWLAVLVGGFAWLEGDQEHEGRILFPLSSSHGITQTDLVFPLVVVLALLLRLVLAIRRRRRRPGWD